jgi:hypothetical protein
MNKCEDIEKRLSAYLEGDVDPKEQMLIEEHLAVCGQCSRTLEGIKKTIELVRNLEEVEPPPWLKQKIMAHVREEAEKRTGIFRKLFFPLHIKIPVEVFAACLVAVMAIYVLKATGPEIQSLQAPSEQRQTADYADKQTREVTPSSTKASKGKAVPDEHYGKNKAASPQLRKETVDTITSREAPPVPKLPLPKLSAALPAVSAGDAKEKEIEGKAEVFQSAPLSAVAPKSAHIKKGDIAASDTAVQYRPGHKSVSNQIQFKTSAAKKQQSITMTAKVDNVPAAAVNVKGLLDRFGATDLKQESQEDSIILMASLPAQKLKELYEKLKTIGEVKENILLYNIPEEEIAVRIEIVNIFKKP